MGTPLTTRQLANEFYNQSPRLQTTKKRENSCQSREGSPTGTQRLTCNSQICASCPRISPTNSLTTRVSRVF